MQCTQWTYQDCVRAGQLRIIEAVGDTIFTLKSPRATGFAPEAMDSFQLLQLMDIDRIHACNALSGLSELAYEQGSYVS
jgi:hypothetical protein